MDGLVFMHRSQIIHRDVKSENILINTDGCLKFADFGLARDLIKPVFDDKTGKYHLPSYTKKVVTPYYRPPEVCLLEPHYDEKVDVWSTGCVFAELIIRRPLFRGTSDLDQLNCILKTLLPNEASFPSQEDWPEFRTLLDKVYPQDSFPEL